MSVKESLQVPGNEFRLPARGTEMNESSRRRLHWDHEAADGRKQACEEEEKTGEVVLKATNKMQHTR